MEIKEKSTLSKKHLYIIIFVFAIGIIIRFSGLNLHSVWYDEGGSINYAKNNIRAVVFSEANHPPMHLLLLHFLGSCFGYEVTYLRASSALLGVISLFLFYKIISLLFNEKTIVLLGLTFFSLSPFQLYFSQEIRNFMLFQTFTLASIYLFIKILKEDSPKLWFLYGLITILNLYTFYFSAFIILSQALFILFFKRSRLKNFSIVMVVDFLLFLPWIIFFLKNVGDIGRGYIKQFIFRFFYLFLTFSIGYSGVLLNYYEKLDIVNTIKSSLIIIPCALFFGIPFIKGVILSFRNREHGYLLAFLFFLPLIILSLLFPFKPYLVERYLIFIFPIYIIYLMFGFSKAKYGWTKTLFAAAIICLELFSLNNYFFNENYGKEDYKGAAAYVLEKSENDIIIFHKSDIAKSFLMYYKKDSRLYGFPNKNIYNENINLVDMKRIIIRDSRIIIPAPERFRLSENSHEPYPMFLDSVKGFDNIWFVLGKNWDTKFKYKDLLDNQLTLQDTKFFPKMNGVHVFKYRVTPPSNK